MNIPNPFHDCRHLCPTVTHKPYQVRLRCELCAWCSLFFYQKRRWSLGFCWRTKVEPKSTQTSNKWFHCQLELIRTTWKGYDENEANAVVKRDIQAMKTYQSRDWKMVGDKEARVCTKRQHKFQVYTASIFTEVCVYWFAWSIFLLFSKVITGVDIEVERYPFN
jgi:hypothetical protein